MSAKTPKTLLQKVYGNCLMAKSIFKGSMLLGAYVSPPHDKLRMFNLSSCVEPTPCSTQKYRLLYTINYGTAQPMMKSGILFCAYDL